MLFCGDSRRTSNGMFSGAVPRLILHDNGCSMLFQGALEGLCRTRVALWPELEKAPSWTSGSLSSWWENQAVSYPGSQTSISPGRSCYCYWREPLLAVDRAVQGTAGGCPWSLGFFRLARMKAELFSLLRTPRDFARYYVRVFDLLLGSPLTVCPYENAWHSQKDKDAWKPIPGWVTLARADSIQ